jgi:cephalosporin hydroxylase
MFDRKEFDTERSSLIASLGSDVDLKRDGISFVNSSNLKKYAYTWNWMGLPVIQMPEDLIKVQEIIFETKPDIILETGVAWGGSLLFYASILKSMNHGKVIGIDITIPEHNRTAIMNSRGSELVTLIEGSSVSQDIFKQVNAIIPRNAKVLLILDSHHTHDHVMKELELWSPLVTKGNYLVVCDTIVEFIDAPADRVRAWSKGNNPFTATTDFLSSNIRFSTENEFNKKTLTSFHPHGFLLAIS